MSQIFKIWIVANLFFCNELIAQPNYRFINFTAKEGLTEKIIYSATQDQQGYMWFGTASGLCRYDGHKFKMLNSPVDQPGRAISNILQFVLTANNGTIWLGGFNTLQWYQPKQNKFWGPDYNQPSVKRLCDAYICSFTEDQSHNMYIATVNDYFFRFNSRDSSFTSYAAAFPKTASKITLKIILAEQSVWAIHQEGIYRFSSAGVLESFHPYNDLSGAIEEPETGSLLLTTYSRGLIRFNLKDKVFTDNYTYNNVLKKNNLFQVNKIDPQNIWIGSYPLFHIDPKNNLEVILAKNETDYDLKNSKIVCVFPDREKNLWICSYSGLSMLPWQNQQVEQYMLKDQETGAMIEPIGVYTLPETKDMLIANTSTKGLVYIEPATKKLSIISNNGNRENNHLPIHAIIPAPDGSIYLSDDAHIFKFLPKEKKLVPFPILDQNNQPLINAARNVMDNKGILYIGSVNNGFYTWDTRNNKLLHYNRSDIDTAAAAKLNNELYPCLADRDNNIWFTSNSGVYVYYTKNNSFAHFAYKQINNVPLLTTANYITQDKAGHYWITTKNNGLYELYFDQGKELLQNYSQNSNIGLPSDYLIKIKPDLKDSSLWISYISGLIKFDPIRKKVTTILNQQNGLYMDGGGYTFTITPENQLLQIHYGALNSIDLNRYQFNKNSFPVIFNSVMVMDKEKKYGLDTQNPELNLSYNENFIQFEFSALHFNNSNQVQYAYMLEGLDKDWIYSANRNSVSYSGLNPGTYYFKVKAANNDGVWSEKITTIKIVIRQPFYKRWWFIFLCLLFPAILLLAWNRYKIKQVKKEEALKSSFQQQIALTEMKALRAQMNPHFIFNSLNSIQKYILSNDHFAASQYLTKFSRLIRLILDHSNESTILLSSELDLLKLYIEMESLRFEEKFSYAILVEPNIPLETTEIPSMLIQPYVENAIWHGLLHKEEKGNLTLHFAMADKTNLMVTIEDNGIGREKAAVLKSKQVLKKKSYGMQITEDRIAILNLTQHFNATCIIQDLKDKEGNGIGTKVILTIPEKQTTA